MNLPGHRIAVCLGKAALKTHALQTLPRGPLTRPRARSVLECVRFIGAFRPARDGQRFMVPMHAEKRKRAFHEPSFRPRRRSRPRPRSDGFVSKTRTRTRTRTSRRTIWFMVPMHAEKTKEGFP